MKRIFMLLAVALMLAAAMALSGVAQAASPSSKCQQEAAILGISGSYNFIAGSDRNNDNFNSKATAGTAEVFCGFGDNDQIGTLEAGDIFIGGAGDDSVAYNRGTFNGGAGNDSVRSSNTSLGTFNGGDGNDYVDHNYGTFNQD